MDVETRKERSMTLIDMIFWTGNAALFSSCCIAMIGWYRCHRLNLRYHELLEAMGQYEGPDRRKFAGTAPPISGPDGADSLMHKLGRHYYLVVCHECGCGNVVTREGDNWLDDLQKGGRVQ
jgi:hypothetical protein